MSSGGGGGGAAAGAVCGMKKSTEQKKNLNVKYCHGVMEQFDPEFFCFFFLQR